MMAVIPPLTTPSADRSDLVYLDVWEREADVDGARIFPHPEGALPDRYDGFDDDIADYPAHVRAHPVASFVDIPELEAGLRGLEETRRVDLEAWMDAMGPPPEA